jgi:hypothetical protein
MITPMRWFVGSEITLSLLLVSGSFAQTPAPVQTFPLHDTTGLIAPKLKTEAVKYLGRECIRITVDGDDRDGLTATGH